MPEENAVRHLRIRFAAITFDPSYTQWTLLDSLHVIIIVFIISGIIEEHPTSVTAAVDEWASFNCSVNCTERISIRWRLVVPKMAVVNEFYYGSNRLQRKWGMKGITIEPETSSRDSVDIKTSTIHVLVTSQMDGAVFQCAAIKDNVDPFYSKFAVLQVPPLQESMENRANNETTAATSLPH